MPKLYLLLTAIIMLCACSGGGGGGGSTPPQAPEPNTPVPPPANDPQDAFSCGSGGATVTADQAPGSYVLFESAAVRPLALSASGDRLLVTNTAANCLEIYAVAEAGLTFESAVMVGLDPVAVAFANDTEAWVINHLSDSISIVDLNDEPYVKQTLQVGDEPRDIVFAGENKNRAFVTTAFRGQNHPQFSSDDLLAPGIGRANVWVYERSSIDNSPNGNPLRILQLFTDSPRALATSPDGMTVYAAGFLSGNGTTSIGADVVAQAKPLPVENRQGVQQPDTALIVKNVADQWLDEAGTDWSSSVLFDLPDLDIFAIDAATATPTVTDQIAAVGTVIFNLATNPATGELYASNLEAMNQVRFEGPGETSTTVRGHIAETRISRIAGPTLQHTHLNSHIDFDVDEGSTYPQTEVDKSLSQVGAMAVSPDGNVLYAAAFGSAKVAAIPTQALRNGSYVPDASAHLQLPAGGPAGLVLNTDGSRLIVYTRFDNAISLWDTDSGEMLAQQSLFTPEPQAVISGRPFLYDAIGSSANGTSACSSCHIFGDMDQLAWDLGNPDAELQDNNNPYVANSPQTTIAFHPMKGPMTTQTFRGIADSGPQHWRGDRSGQNRATVNGELESIEAAAFKEFNPAFVGLVGRSDQLSNEDMQAFTDFALAITPPPNPIRALDNSLNGAQENGRDIYFNENGITGLGSCNNCHSLAPENKQFGTSGLMSFEGVGIAENFKVPHFRNAYAKVGMFGTSGFFGNGQFTGDQIKGFGYLHDGSMATLLDFFASPTFNFPEPALENQRDIVRFVMAADSNMAPIVGQQLTLLATSTEQDFERLGLLESRAAVNTGLPECDLIVRGRLDNLRYSALRQNNGEYLDTDNNRKSSDTLRRAVAQEGNILTFTCLPPGSGRRAALNTS